jgi:glycosyltransferase involved in cell wall biosynthesis
VIPAFNAAATIAHTLQSVAAQTSAAWEVVVVDDGSADGTAAIADRFARDDGRFRVQRQANAGEAAARNAGIVAARHEWLLFLDADDWIAPGYLTSMTSVLETDAALDAVVCGSARVARDGTIVDEPYRPPAGDLFPVLARRSAFPVHACVVRRRLVEEVGGFDPTLRTSPDWDLWQRVARTGARFGSVPERLAYYRMSPLSASLDARQLLTDGMRVLRQGCAPDPRVPRPHPSHAGGVAEPVASQQFYLLAWCAGLAIGARRDVRPLFGVIDDAPFPALHAPAIAECLFGSVPLPACEGPAAWEALWPGARDRIADFLEGLETRAAAPALAALTLDALKRRILRVAPSWREIAAQAEQERRQAEQDREQAEQDRRQADEDRQQTAATIDSLRSDIARLEETVRELTEDRARLERAGADLARELAARIAERNQLRDSGERQVGDLVLNRLGLKKPLMTAAGAAAAVRHRIVLAGLRRDGRANAGRLKVMATACDVFPIYSQTFVYQELVSLLDRGCDLRFIYSKLDAQDRLGRRFARLWDVKRPLVLDRANHERDYAHYRRRLPGRVDELTRRIAETAGMPIDHVRQHDNFLQAFSFTRLVEAYAPDYLHSYFFYDRSLMTLVAGYLLGIPRGVSCYADHLLQDYELKIVPLHLELCDIVIATSARIRGELLALGPGMDERRIIVKPNGIDTRHFAAPERPDPAANAPFRIVSVCRIEPKKGLIDLVEALALLRQRGVAAALHIVGAADEWSDASRDYRARLEQRIAELGLGDLVHLEGRHDADGVRRFLEQAHLFAAPFVETASGDKDGIPTAVLEAMASGLPVVATDAGSITEVVRDGCEGLFVAQGDPDALSAAIETLARSSDRRRAMAAAAVRRVHEAFDATQLDQVFHERVAMIAGRAGRDR